MPIIATAGVRPLFIPPAALRFRLVNKATGNRVLCRYLNPALVMGIAAAEPVEDNQFWRLLPGDGLFSNEYRIVPDHSDNFTMYADGPGGRSEWCLRELNHLRAIGVYFQFQQVHADDEWFNIINQNYNLKCFMRPEATIQLGTVDADSASHDDQLFKFEVDNMEVDKLIQYHLHSASILNEQRTILGSQTINNNGSVAQSHNLCVSHAKSHFQSFEYTSGRISNAGTTFQVGVPFIANGKIGVTASPMQTCHWGKSVTNISTVEWNVQVNTPPRRQYRITNYITEGQLKIPYTMTLRSTMTGSTVVSSGVATGFVTWDLYTDYQDVGPAVSGGDGTSRAYDGGGNN